MKKKKPTALKKKPVKKPTNAKRQRKPQKVQEPADIPREETFRFEPEPVRVVEEESDYGPDLPTGGRPRVQIDLDQLESIMRLNPSLEDTADFFKCSEDTITRIIKRDFNMGFAEFRRKNQVQTRLAAKRKLVNMWEKKDNLGALIWYMKNEMGWADKVEATQNVTIKPLVTYEAKWGGNTEPTDGNKLENTEHDEKDE